MYTFTIITDLREYDHYSKNGFGLRGKERVIPDATRHDVLALQSIAKNIGAKFTFYKNEDAE